MDVTLTQKSEMFSFLNRFICGLQMYDKVEECKDVLIVRILLFFIFIVVSHSTGLMVCACFRTFYLFSFVF